MELEWEQLYRSMQEELIDSWQRHADEKAAIEHCFQISMQYWSMIEIDARENFFSSAAEEMDFYKHIKPLFVSEISYLNMRYHAALFLPEGTGTGEREFWERERQRLPKFMRDHEDFCSYYKSESTEMDARYFMKGCLGKQEEGLPQYDLLASTLIALERYSAFVKSQMQR